MAVKLRLMRMGKTKQPTYRLVAADGRSPRNGRFIEILGTYNPRTEPSEINLDNEKVVGWLRKGAQPTDTARKLLEISGAWAEFTGTTPPPRPAPAPKAAAAPEPAPAAEAEEAVPAAEAAHGESAEVEAASEDEETE